MTRDEHRAKCFEAQAIAAFEYMCWPVKWKDTDETARNHWLRGMRIAFDALPTAGARVVPIDATVEMLEASLWRQPKHFADVEEEWRRMSARGDLTNPPEKTP